MDELRQHKNSDKFKWFLTLIAFIIVGITLCGIVFEWFTPKTEKPEETKPNTEQTESANTDVSNDYSTDFVNTQNVKLMSAGPMRAVPGQNYAEQTLSARDITGISNKTLKGAPRLKTVLKQLKDFTNGYEVYARNSEFINKFLTYYGNKNGVETNLAKADDCDEISRFLRCRNIIGYLKNTKDPDPLALAKLIVE